MELYGNKGRLPTDLEATICLMVKMGAVSRIMEAMGAELLHALTHGATAVVGATMLRAVWEGGVFRTIDCGLLTKAAAVAPLVR